MKLTISSFFETCENCVWAIKIEFISLSYDQLGTTVQKTVDKYSAILEQLENHKSEFPFIDAIKSVSHYFIIAALTVLFWANPKSPWLTYIHAFDYAIGAIGVVFKLSHIKYHYVKFMCEYGDRYFARMIKLYKNTKNI